MDLYFDLIHSIIFLLAKNQVGQAGSGSRNWIRGCFFSAISI